jgi:hypothetical protein
MDGHPSRRITSKRRNTMFRVIFGISLIMHGLVHLLYAGQSGRIFELQPGMIWPNGSWALSRVTGTDVTRPLATFLLVVGAIVFVVGGGGLLLKQAWWRPFVLAATVFSSLIYFLLWDGAFQDLANKGAIGILINAAILAASLVGYSYL